MDSNHQSTARELPRIGPREVQSIVGNPIHVDAPVPNPTQELPQWWVQGSYPWLCPMVNLQFLLQVPEIFTLSMVSPHDH